MKRQLVELNPETFSFKVIDIVKMKRTGNRFKQWLLQIDSQKDEFGLRKFNLPIIEAALNGTLSLPFNDPPFQWEVSEGLVRADYLEISAPFYNTIRGAHLVPPLIIHENGKMFAWKYFEEQSDEHRLNSEEQSHVDKARRR